ncbi:MAG: hypothetical protein U9O64_01060 [Campylobacterota bacterium]|nr:hypothetical protein [Campylobacterota bacterium]
MKDKDLKRLLNEEQEKKNYSRPTLQEIGKIDKYTKGGGTQDSLDSPFPNLIPS